ncbi:hypothetical protein MBLNU457_7248t1 [Dothideomycetes sp. NU457]
MFELPEAKRVRRSELQAGDSSRESSIDLEATERLRSGDFFATDTVDKRDASTVQESAEVDDEELEDEEVAFRLFAPTKADGARQDAQVIRLRSPTAEERDPGFISSRRSNTYYFTGSPSTQLQQEYNIAAVTGDDVRLQAKARWPGSAYPWRTITIPTSQAKQVLVNANRFAKLVPQDEVKKRTRLGKNGRIKKRQKMAVRAAKKADEAKAKEEKELAEREKRARRNREKKFKKRARDKAKKSAMGTAEGKGDAEDAEVDDGTSSDE